MAATLPQGRSAADWLQWAVDEPTPSDRESAAVELSELEEFSIEDWILAASSFAPKAAAPKPGRRTATPSLSVVGIDEPTEISCYVSKGYDHGKPAPLIVALHGAGGTGRSEAQFWEKLADSTGGVVIGPSEAGANLGYRGELRERESVMQAIRWARREYNVDETRVWMTGYSRGAHLAWDFALRSSDVVAGVISQAGAPLFGSDPPASPLRLLPNLRGLRVSSFVGEHDQPLLHSNLALVAAYVEDEELEGVALETLAGAEHGIPHQGSRRDWTEWSKGAQRESWPTSITRAAFELEDAKSAWLQVTKFDKSVVKSFELTVRAPRGKTLTQAELREQVLADAIKKTSLVEAERGENGRFVIRARGAAALTILLREDWIPPKDKKLSVRVNRRNQKVPVERSAEVLLETFVERFDRTFLPVAEARVKVRTR